MDKKEIADSSGEEDGLTASHRLVELVAYAGEPPERIARALQWESWRSEVVLASVFSALHLSGDPTLVIAATSLSFLMPVPQTLLAWAPFRSSSAKSNASGAIGLLMDTAWLFLLQGISIFGLSLIAAILLSGLTKALIAVGVFPSLPYIVAAAVWVLIVPSIVFNKVGDAIAHRDLGLLALAERQRVVDSAPETPFGWKHRLRCLWSTLGIALGAFVVGFPVANLGHFGLVPEVLSAVGTTMLLLGYHLALQHYVRGLLYLGILNALSGIRSSSHMRPRRSQKNPFLPDSSGGP